MALNDFVPGSIGNAFIDGESFSDLEVVSPTGSYLEFKDSNGDHIVAHCETFSSFTKTGSVTPSTPQFGQGVTLTDYWGGVFSFEVSGLSGEFMEVDLGGGDVRTWRRIQVYKITP